MENSETQTELIPDAGPKRRRPLPRGVVLFLLLAVLAAGVAALPALRGGNTDPNASPPAPSPTPRPIPGVRILMEKLPEWFPGETWSEVLYNSEKSVNLIRYMDPNGNVLFFADSPAEGTVINVGAGDAQVPTDLRVHGYEARMSAKEGKVHLVWTDTDRDRVFDLELQGAHPDFTPETARMIAESLYEVERPRSDAPEAPAPEHLNAEAILTQELPGWFPGETWTSHLFWVETIYLVDFMTPTGYEISYSSGPTDGSTLGIDTENAEVRTDIRVHGYEALMSVKEGQLILVWADTDRDLLCEMELHGPHPDFTPEMLLRMAERLYEVDIPLPEPTKAPGPEHLDAEAVLARKLPGWFPGESWSASYLFRDEETCVAGFEDPAGNFIYYSGVSRDGCTGGLHSSAKNVEVRWGLQVHGCDAQMALGEEWIALGWTDADRDLICELRLVGPHPGFTPEMALEVAESLYPGD